ncbi:MAG: gliding motility-associated C-terminal domain-containing protein [Bacteroidales bacterium]
MLKTLFLTTIYLAGALATHTGSDTDRPEPPVIKSVSVINNEGHVVIEWEKSPSPGITYYELNEYTPIGSSTIAGEINHDSTRFLHITREPDTRPFSYDMRAIRITEHDTTYSPLSDHHTTIHTSSQWDSCAQSNTLNWTSYEGWEEASLSYQIYYSINNGNFEKAETPGTTDTLFRHTDIETNREYCYYIEAEHNDGLTSRSSTVCLYTGMLKSPEWINADYATVENNSIELGFTIDPKAETSYYRLLRSGNPEDDFTVIHNYQANPSGHFVYTDNNAETANINYYLLEAINTCNEVSAVSNLASNIVLEASNKGFTAFIGWNEYREWRGGTDSWQLYRTSEQGILEPILTLDARQTSITDDLETIHRESLRSEFCYLVEAREAPGNPYGISAISRSNTACINLSSGIFFPNAFTPDGDGQNDEFYPVMLFRPEDYLLVVMDRMGNRIFESRIPENKWNGKTGSGSNAPEGVYLYFLHVKTPDGEIIEKKGHVVLFYP